jgi:hypothetical protein
MKKTEEKKLRVKHTLEELKTISEKRTALLNAKLKSREVKHIWVSEFRVKKSELNHAKEMDYTTKIQKFVNWLYNETGIQPQIETETETKEE